MSLDLFFFPTTTLPDDPGSISLPKGGYGRTFGYFDGETLRHVPVPAAIRDASAADS